MADKPARVRRTSPVGVACFVYVFSPQAAREGSKNKEPKYKTVLSFDADTMKSDEMRQLKLACIECAEAKWGANARDQIKKGKIKMPWRPGTDYEENGFPFDREGSYFINFQSKEQPGVVSRKAKPIKDPKEVYSGMTARVTYAPWAYDTDGNKGVTLFLNNLQKVADGDRLAGRPDAEDDFEAMEGEDGSEVDDIDDI